MYAFCIHFDAMMLHRKIVTSKTDILTSLGYQKPYNLPEKEHNGTSLSALLD